MGPEAYNIADQPPLPLDDEHDENESSPFNGQFEKQRENARHREWTVSWIRSPAWFCFTLILLVIVVGQNAYDYAGPKDCARAIVGYPTEFDEVKPTIREYQKRFTSAIRHYVNGSLYTSWDPSEPRYTTSGGSYEDVDSAWDDLLVGRYVRLKDSEVEWMNFGALQNMTPITNLSWVKPGDYYGGPDMLHSLHCLNGLRKHLDYDHYRDQIKLPEEYRKMHVDHCIDQLRQAVLCAGDMTPVSLKPVVSEDGSVWALLGETEYTHTCRNGLELREWWRSRGEESGRLEIT